jgi:hypothetical protein
VLKIDPWRLIEALRRYLIFSATCMAIVSILVKDSVSLAANLATLFIVLKPDRD